MRAETLAATRLTLSGIYLDGRTAERSCRPRQQLHHDDELQTAAAALLANRTGKSEYWDWYQRLWAYSWTHFVDHQYGAWFRILDQQNRKLSDEKSPAGKVDYHTMGACYDILTVLGEADHA